MISRWIVGHYMVIKAIIPRATPYVTICAPYLRAIFEPILDNTRPFTVLSSYSHPSFLSRKLLAIVVNCWLTKLSIVDFNQPLIAWDFWDFLISHKWLLISYDAAQNSKNPTSFIRRWVRISDHSKFAAVSLFTSAIKPCGIRLFCSSSVLCLALPTPDISETLRNSKHHISLQHRNFHTTLIFSHFRANR